MRKDESASHGGGTTDGERTPRAPPSALLGRGGVAAATMRGVPGGPNEAGPSPRGGGTDGATDGEGASRTPPSAPLGRALFGRRWREITVRTEM